MIVAVSAFNMGAMENKGLNVFNDKYILARPDTATDADYAAIEAIIAHEYFHNWTGNRITCRDWFQLCLKEGLTVYRDQEFIGGRCARAHSEADHRMCGCCAPHQFYRGWRARSRIRSDPTAISRSTTSIRRPSTRRARSWCRMIADHSRARNDFRRGMDLYFDRHDGQAATVGEFSRCAGRRGGSSTSRNSSAGIRRSGTPEVLASGRYDAARKTYTLKLSQVCAPTPGQPVKEPYHIPIALGLVGPDGRDIKLQLDGEDKPGATTRVLSLTEREATWRFRNVADKPVPSLLRGFTAPVKLSTNLKERDLVFLMAHDSDSFNRWEAAQRYATGLLIAMVNAQKQGGAPRKGAAFAEADAGGSSRRKKTDPDFAAQMIVLPSEQTLAQAIGKDVDVDAIHAAREGLRASIAAQLKDELLAAYALPSTGLTTRMPRIAKQARAAQCLAFLAVAPGTDGVELAAAQFAQADNMTDEIAALSVLANIDCPERVAALRTAHARWRGQSSGDGQVVVDPGDVSNAAKGRSAK